MASLAERVLMSDDGPEFVALYLGSEEGDLVDLEVAALAAIEWARGLQAAASAIAPDFDYRVSLVAAAPGSSKWFVRLERALQAIEESTLNQQAKRIKEGYRRVPLIIRLAAGLVVAVPLTAKPTIDFWLGHSDFSPAQVAQIEQAVRKAQDSPEVRSHRRRVYQILQRDTRIKSLGSGLASNFDWKPTQTVPASEFPLADGLFELQEMAAHERILNQEIDVVLVTPRLQNAQKAWEFRQEGIPGSFKAQMKDRAFLRALDQQGVAERLRANIPMRIQLEIKQQLIDGEWRVAPKGRSVIRVLRPAV